MASTTERYPTPESDPVARLAKRVAELERQVRQLTGARPLQHTALTGGVVVVVDPVTGDAVRMGVVRVDAEGEKFGLSISSGAAQMFEVNSQDGFVVPAFDLMPIPQKQLGAGPYVITTSGSFEALYRVVADATHKAVAFTAIVVTDAATVGEIRIRHGSGAVSGVITCPAGGQTTVLFRWLHHQTIGSGPHQFDLEGRRTSGAGSVFVFWPQKAAMIGPTTATENGLV